MTAPALDLSASALITIDVQIDTLDGQPLEVPGTSAVLPQLGRLSEAFRHAGRPIVHVVRLYLDDGSNAEPFRRPAVTSHPVFRRGTSGRSLAHELLPASAPELDDVLLLSGQLQPLGADEVAMYKPRWGAFHETPLGDHLSAHDIGTVVIAGCNFPNCPRATIYEAGERDLQVIAVADATSGATDERLADLAAIGVSVMSTDKVTAALRTCMKPNPRNTTVA